MWSWGKVGKGWNVNAYYHQINISESPRSSLNILLSTRNIFPNLAQVTNHDFLQSTSQQKLSHGWVLPPVPSHQCSLTWQESHHSCQWPGSPHAPGGYPGEELRAPALLTCWHSFSRPAEITGSQTLFSLLVSPHSIYFSFCWQQSNVPGSCFECLCSTWDHFNTFADGLEHFFFPQKWAMNSKSFCHIPLLIYKYIWDDCSHFSTKQPCC